MSTLLLEAGFSTDEVERLGSGDRVKKLVGHLCSELRNWFIDNLGKATSELMVRYYGLHGEERESIERIAPTLNLTLDHAAARRLWALKKLREDEVEPSLCDLVASQARRFLEMD